LEEPPTASFDGGPARFGSMAAWWAMTAWCSAFDSRIVPEG
jgi:hypothetical protein